MPEELEQEVAASEATEAVEEETTEEESASSEDESQTTSNEDEGDSADELLSSPDIKEKTKERIRSLSAKVKELETERVERENREDLWSKINPATPQPALTGEEDPGSVALKQINRFIISQDMERTFEAYPQLNPENKESFDPDFDRLVAGYVQDAWSRGDKIAIRDAATKVDGYLKKQLSKAESAGAKKATESVSEKEKAAFAPSAKPTRAGVDLNGLFAKAQRTGKTEDWVAYEDAKAELNIEQ